ncbi:MAG TPA: MFS transporter [Thermoanaerobaculia bacterium]|nr:MFS transporter [Thermoanaerobaculia bacterium]
MERGSRNVVLVSAAMFLLSGGENLWRKFLPKYLQALGAPIRAVGFYGSIEDFLDGIYQYPGGFLGDHLGRRKALLLFVALAMVGYAIYAAAPAWTWAIVALVFAMAWSSMASPTLFAVVGDALPKERRALGFTLQAVLRRVPILVAPIAGGVVIARLGVVRGVQILCAVTFVLGALTLVVVSKVRIERIAGAPTNIRGVWRAMPPPLRWLLLSDIFIRTCEGLVDEFVVIWAMSIAGLSAPQYGVLVAVQVATSIAVYLPAAKVADRIGRKPVVIATFLCFSLFPVAVVAAGTFKTMIAAFVVGGLREIGEPARKALIVDLAQPVLRARTVGLYYLIRSVAITPAAFVGGLLWEQRPSLPFFFAMGVGLAGTLLFALTATE